MTLPNGSGPGHPPQLDDRDWLARRYAQVGDMAIALELHCNRQTVIRMRRFHGIPSQPAGRRRGSSTRVNGSASAEDGSRLVALPGTEEALLERFRADQERKGAAPSDELLAKRIHAYAQARAAGDFMAMQDARLAIASVAGLIHQHEARRRKTGT